MNLSHAPTRERREDSAQDNSGDNALLLLIALVGLPYVTLGGAIIKLLEALGERVIAGVCAVASWTRNLMVSERLLLGFGCTCILLILASVWFAWLTLPALGPLTGLSELSTNTNGLVNQLSLLLNKSI